MSLFVSLRSPRAGLVALLSVTQIVGWGTSFEMPGVLGRPIAAGLGLANEVVFLGLTVMMLTMAAAGPRTGRLIERHGAARVLAAGSALLGLGLLGLSLCQGVIAYFAAWLVLGLGGAFGLSVPTYAAVVEREGANAKRSIAVLMIFTGLSSAVCWPLLGLLEQQYGWRVTLQLAAAFHLVVCLPAHLFLLPQPAARSAAEAAAARAEPLPLAERQARLAFLLIALAITLVTLVSFGVSPSLIRMLELSGASPMLALQLGSLRSVFGITARAVDLVLGRRSSPLATFLAGLGLIVVSTVVLLLFSGAGAAIVFVVLYGFGTGVVTVARALIPLVFFSPDRFARQSARLSLPQNLASAAAPVLMTTVLDRQGLTAVILLCLGLSLAALLALLLLARIASRARLHPISPLEGEMSRSDRGG